MTLLTVHYRLSSLLEVVNKSKAHTCAHNATMFNCETGEYSSERSRLTAKSQSLMLMLRTIVFCDSNDIFFVLLCSFNKFFWYTTRNEKEKRKMLLSRGMEGIFEVMVVRQGMDSFI